MDGDNHNDYECISQANTTSITNISCIESSHSTNTTDSTASVKAAFNRSKSNIETFSNKTQIHIQNGTTTNNKLRPLETNLDDDNCSDRGQADGGSNQQDSDFDEFSSQDDDDEQSQGTQVGRKEHKAGIEKSLTTSALSNGGMSATENYYQNTSEIKEQQQHILNSSPLNNSHTAAAVVLGRCKALYNYTPKLYDELELNPGDIIEVHAKQEDGWWLGALKNQIGIFPATYVEELA